MTTYTVADIITRSEPPTGWDGYASFKGQLYLDDSTGTLYQSESAGKGVVWRQLVTLSEAQLIEFIGERVESLSPEVVTSLLFDEGALHTQLIDAVSDRVDAEIPSAVELAISENTEVVQEASESAARGASALAQNANRLIKAEFIPGKVLDFVDDNLNNPFLRFREMDPSQGWKWALTVIGSDGKERVYFGVRNDGTMYPSQNIVDDGSTSDPSPQAGPNITCIGDSLTAGGYPAALQTLLTSAGKPGIVRNLGVGGESSRSIIGRSGGRPLLATITGGVIPTSGPVSLILYADTLGETVPGGGTETFPNARPMEQGSAGINPVTIAGVQGTLSHTTGTDDYVFTRSVSGSAVTVGYPVPILTNARTFNRGDIYAIMVGQNDAADRTADDASVLISRINAQIAWQNADQKKFVVMGWHTSGLSSRANSRKQYRAAYGRRFIDHYPFLCSQAGLAMAGITPTTADNSAIAAGTLPPSLWASGVDSVHLNSAGYGLIAWLVFDRLTELGDI